MEWTIEKRVIRDVNGFYQSQIRFLPLESWESGDGWRTICISSIPFKDAVVVLDERKENKMEAADYRRMSTFELIDRINMSITWADEDNEPCMRELCDRYHIDFDSYHDYEDLWDLVTREVYDDAVVHNEYSINDHDYVIVSLDSDEFSEYAVINRLNNNIMFNVYFIGTMRECKQYIKECVDNDD